MRNNIIALDLEGAVSLKALSPSEKGFLFASENIQIFGEAGYDLIY